MVEILLEKSQPGGFRLSKKIACTSFDFSANFDRRELVDPLIASILAIIQGGNRLGPATPGPKNSIFSQIDLLPAFCATRFRNP